MSDPDATYRDLLSKSKMRFFSAMPAPSYRASCLWLKVENIREWANFDQATLDDAYGHVLGLGAKGTAKYNYPSLVMEFDVRNTIKSDRDLDHLMLWNKKMIHALLGPVQSELNLHPGVQIMQEYPAPQTAGGKQDRIHTISLDNDANSVLVKGLAIPSTLRGPDAFDSAISGKLTQAVIKVLRHLGSLCKSGETRYGYVQTDQDTVFCRFSKSPVDSLNAEIKRVPWVRSGNGAVTSDAGLLWMAVMAMSGKENRAVVASGQMAGLDKWDDFAGEHGAMKRHRYSKREKPADQA